MTLPPQVESKLVWTAAVVIVPWIARAILLRSVGRRGDDLKARYRWRKVTQYLVMLGVIGGLSAIWLENLREVSTFVGLAAAGLAVALTQPLTNIAGWALIMMRRPFDVGDRIQIGQTRGDVIDQGVFQFALMEIGEWVAAEQSTGRVVHVPNARIFNEPLANYNHDFPYIWVELPVLVTFESDWQTAKQLLSDIASDEAADVPEQAEEAMRKVTQRYMVRIGQLTPIVYTSVRESGVLLTVRMLAAPRRRRALEERVWERVLRAFAAHDDIDLAYPTRRFYDLDRNAERKPS